MRKEKVIVTGGAGFIGSHVVDRLVKKEKYDVYILDDFSTGKISNIKHSKSIKEIICADIADSNIKKIISQIDPDYIIHLAAQSSVAISQKNTLLDTESNILGIVNILEAMKLCKCKKIIFAASGGTIYGNVNGDNLPLKETLPLQATSFYGLTKLTGIHYLNLYKEHFRFNYCALALGNVYGPRQNPYGESGVIAIFTNNIINNVICKINGDGNITRDYIYVEDVADAFVKALYCGENIINIGTNIETSVNTIFDKIKNISQKNIDCIYGKELPGEVHRVKLDNELARSSLNWKPTISLDEGLKMTYYWFLNNQELLK